MKCKAFHYRYWFNRHTLSKWLQQFSGAGSGLPIFSVTLFQLEKETITHWLSHLSSTLLLHLQDSVVCQKPKENLCKVLSSIEYMRQANTEKEEKDGRSTLYTQIINCMTSQNVEMISRIWGKMYCNCRIGSKKWVYNLDLQPSHSQFWNSTSPIEWAQHGRENEGCRTRPLLRICGMHRHQLQIYSVPCLSTCHTCTLYSKVITLKILVPGNG